MKYKLNASKINLKSHYREPERLQGQERQERGGLVFVKLYKGKENNSENVTLITQK